MQKSLLTCWSAVCERNTNRITAVFGVLSGDKIYDQGRLIKSIQLLQETSESVYLSPS